MEFLELDVVEAIHDRQVAQHGGLDGIRDRGLLESAVARPRNAYAYGESDGYALAASYAFGIARNHPFLDANKRTALHAALSFLRLNDLRLPPVSPALVELMVAVAQGAITEANFAHWLRQQADTPAAGSD